MLSENLYESRDGREWPGGSAAYHGVPTLAPLGQVMDAALSADVPPPGFLASGYGKCRFCMGHVKVTRARASGWALRPDVANVLRSYLALA